MGCSGHLRKTPRRRSWGTMRTRRAVGASAFLDFLDFGVHHIVVGRTAGLLGLLGARGRTAGGTRRSLLLGVELFAQLLAGQHQGLGLGLDVSLVLALDGFFQLLGGSLDLFLLGGIELV